MAVETLEMIYDWRFLITLSGFAMQIDTVFTFRVVISSKQSVVIHFLN